MVILLCIKGAVVEYHGEKEHQRIDTNGITCRRKLARSHHQSYKAHILRPRQKTKWFGQADSQRRSRRKRKGTAPPLAYSGRHRTSEDVIARRRPSCAERQCIHGGSEWDKVLERTHHMKKKKNIKDVTFMSDDAGIRTTNKSYPRRCPPTSRFRQEINFISNTLAKTCAIPDFLRWKLRNNAETHTLCGRH